MATEPVEARLARLEGVYEQIDRRLGSMDDRLGRLEGKVDALGNRLEGKIDALGNRLDAKIDGGLARLDTKIDAVAVELRRDLGTLNGRIHTLLYGIIAAVLVPVLIRVFFP